MDSRAFSQNLLLLIRNLDTSPLACKCPFSTDTLAVASPSRSKEFIESLRQDVATRRAFSLRFTQSYLSLSLSLVPLSKGVPVLSNWTTLSETRGASRESLSAKTKLWSLSRPFRNAGVDGVGTGPHHAHLQLLSDVLPHGFHDSVLDHSEFCLES